MNCGTFVWCLKAPKSKFGNLCEFTRKDIVRTWLTGTTDHRIIGLATCQEAGVGLEPGLIRQGLIGVVEMWSSTELL